MGDSSHKAVCCSFPLNYMGFHAFSPQESFQKYLPEMNMAVKWHYDSLYKHLRLYIITIQLKRNTCQRAQRKCKASVDDLANNRGTKACNGINLLLK